MELKHSIYSLDKQKLQLEKHRALFIKINAYSKAVASAVPEMPPLEVFKTAIQLHQLDPVQSGEEKKPVQVMPNYPKRHPTTQHTTGLGHQLEQLCQILPDIPR